MNDDIVLLFVCGKTCVVDFVAVRVDLIHLLAWKHEPPLINWDFRTVQN